MFRKERKLQGLGNFGSGHPQTGRNANKSKKSLSQKNKKSSRNQTLLQESHQRIKYLGCPTCTILGTILEVDEGRTSTNWSGDKKADNDV